MVSWASHHYHHYPQEPITNIECYCGPCIHVEVLLRGAEMEALGSPVDHNLPKWDIVGPRPFLFLSHAKAFAQSETIANR